MLLYTRPYTQQSSLVHLHTYTPWYLLRYKKACKHPSSMHTLRYSCAISLIHPHIWTAIHTLPFLLNSCFYEENRGRPLWKRSLLLPRNMMVTAAKPLFGEKRWTMNTIVQILKSWASDRFRLPKFLVGITLKKDLGYYQVIIYAILQCERGRISIKTLSNISFI